MSKLKGLMISSISLKQFYRSDLFDVSFWQQAQQMIAAGELPHIYPYARSCRLNRKGRFDSDENRS